MILSSSSSSSDDEDDGIFDLTRSKLSEPLGDPTKRPVQRVRNYKKKFEEMNYSPNVDNVILKLKLREGAKTTRIHSDPFAQEMREVEARIAKVKRGVPLCQILQNDKARKYPLQEERFLYNGVGEEIEALPTISAQRQIKKVQFVMPVSESNKARVSLSERINTSDGSSNRLKKLINRSAAFEIQSHNDMVTYINHANERRYRAMKQFYHDMNEFGYEEAERRSARLSQRSRLRIMSNYKWWNEFIDFVFEKRVTRNEEKLIEKISKIDSLSSTVFIGLIQEINNARYDNTRCLEMLNWINKRCNVLDDNVLSMIKEPTASQSAISSRRTYTNRSIH